MSSLSSPAIPRSSPTAPLLRWSNGRGWSRRSSHRQYRSFPQLCAALLLECGARLEVDHEITDLKTRERGNEVRRKGGRVGEPSLELRTHFMTKLRSTEDWRLNVHANGVAQWISDPDCIYRDLYFGRRVSEEAP